MSQHPLVSGKAGEHHLLLGNEAIVRGALEAGVHVVTCYPGTPSSEVVDTFQHLKGDLGSRYRVEYSVNEKVAMEVACGAALGGGMSLVCMKHVGLNVAADPLFTAAYTGLPGGLVVLSADDPGCHSSQNEQDNRGYARLAGLPCFEPASAQEAKGMTRDAFQLARQLQQPVLMRTTTRVNHMRGAVRFGELPDMAKNAPLGFTRDHGRFVPVPAVALKRHKALAQQLERARTFAESSRFNTCREAGEGVRLGIIASGVARNYLADALATAGWEERVHVLELGMTWPLPTAMIGDFLKKCDRVLILEEGADFLERDVRALAQQLGLAVQLEGKDDILTEFGEFSTSLMLQRLAAWFNVPCPAKAVPANPGPLPGRPPNLCPGCSHRSVYFAARQVFGDDAIYSSDIGCYTLGLLPPLRTADFLICMGSSISGGSGMATTSGKQVVAFIGDSTFFHSGMTGLANAVFNRHNVLLVILDNGTTAMTGHQVNPGMDQKILGDTCMHLDIERIVQALGVEEFVSVGAYNVRGLTKAFNEMREKSGVRVIIAKEPCVLYARRQLKKKQSAVAEVIAQNDDAQNCLKQLACPAFYQEDGKLAVDASLCSGCMVCVQIAPKAFKAKTLEKKA